MILRGLALILAAVATLAASPSRACSVDGSYMQPSNFDLVQLAGAIVIASPEEAYGEALDYGAVFPVRSLVKGEPPERLRIDHARIGTPRGRSDLNDLSASHPESYSGACSRNTFARGGSYLLFLDRDEDGAWRQLPFAFARINEDYEGENNSWMRSVRRYLRLQQTLPPMEQIAALERLARERRDEQGRPLPPAERADIMTHLRAITPWKPTAWLVDLHNRAERGDPLPFPFNEPPLPPAAAEPPREWPAGSAGEVLEELAAMVSEGAAAPEPLPPGLSLRLAVLDALAQGRHPDALPLAERLSGAPDTHRALRGAVLRFLGRHGRFPLAYRWIEQHLLAELALLPAPDARALLGDVEHALRGDSWEEGRERWRGDPHAAATWPALARCIHARQVELFGEDRTLPFYRPQEERP